MIGDCVMLAQIEKKNLVGSRACSQVIYSIWFLNKEKDDENENQNKKEKWK